MVYMAFHFLLRGREWFTFSHGDKTDAARTKPAAESTPIDYPKPDNEARAPRRRR